MKNNDFAKKCQFEIKNNQVFYKKTLKNNEKEEILKLFNKNIKKFTLLGLIFPCACFLLLFVTTITITLIKENKGNFVGCEYNIFFFLIFISILFALLGIFLLYKLLIKKTKCYLTMDYKAYQYKHISKNDYMKICLFLKER